MGSALKISNLLLRSAPGFPEGLPFTLRPGPGLTVVHGPNGSGKTTTSQAAQALLWPGEPELAGFSIRGGFEYEGDAWSLDLNLGTVTIQRAGQDHHHPVGQSSAARDRYNLGLHQLIQADNKSFAEALKKESSGGFDLQAALDKLGLELKTPRKSGTAYTNLQNALKRLNQARAAQADLRIQESELQTLCLTLDQVRLDRDELARLQQALGFIKAGEALKRAELDLAAFPPGMSKLGGQEAGGLDRIRQGLQAGNLDLEKARAELAQNREELDRLGLPDGGTDPLLLEDLKAVVLELDTLTTSIRELEKDLAKARAEIARERAHLGIAEDDCRLDRIDLGKVNGLADLARQAETMRAGQKAQEALEAWLGRDREGIDPEVLKKGLDLLLEWLLDVEEESSSWAVLWKFLVFVGGGLAGTGLVLAWWRHWGWAGAALAGLLVLLWSLKPRVRSGSRTSIQNKFQRLDLTPPNPWTLEQVKQTAGELWEEKAREELARQRRMKWDWLEDKRNELSRQAEELEERRAETASLLGIKPNLDEAVLFNLVERLSRYQDGLNKQAQAQAALDLARDRLRETMEGLASSLAPLGYKDLTKAARFQAAMINLDDRTRKYQQLHNEIRHGKQRIEEVRTRIAALEKERADLFAALDLSPDQEHVLRQWVADLPAYREARDKCSAANRDYEQAREGLDPGSELLTKSAAELEELIRGKEESVARLDGLNQRVGSLSQKLETAKQGHDLEEALAHVKNSKEALRRERDNVCAKAAGFLLAQYLEDRNRAESMPRVFERAREYFRIFTKGAFVLDFDVRGPEFRALDTAASRVRSLNQLSSGTRVQLLMAVRIAFVEDQEKGPALPLFLDETLANSDPERTGAIMESACRILKTGRQIFYFTARPTEVLPWQDLLRENGLEPPAVLDLEDLKAGGRSRKRPLRDIPAVPQPQPPPPQGLSRREYGAELQVPEIDPGRGDLGQAHIWHFLEDPDLVYQALCAGYRDWGPFKNMLLAGALPFLEPGRTEARKALAAARALEEAARLWRIGRGRPVTGQDLAEGGVSETFLAKVAELNQAVTGRADRLILGLKNKEVPRFQASAITRLEEHLEGAGCLDSRPRLTKSEVLEKILPALAPELKEGLLDLGKVEALVSRLDFDGHKD